MRDSAAGEREKMGTGGEGKEVGEGRETADVQKDAETRDPGEVGKEWPPLLPGL